MTFYKQLFYTSTLAFSSLLFTTTNSQAFDYTNTITTASTSSTITYGLEPPASNTPYDTATLNFTTADFNLAYGTLLGEVKDLVLNFSGNKANSVYGYIRRDNAGEVSKSITVNITDGEIANSVAVTADRFNQYNGIEPLREENNLNLSGGTVGGSIIGGAGAENNNIMISGGTVGGNVITGTNSPLLKNRSTNATVTIKNTATDFLSSFVENAAGDKGVISNQHITGSGKLVFDDITGTYKGGIRDFDEVAIDGGALQLDAVEGKTYKADIWSVNGDFTTNGKTISAKTGNDTIALNISSAGKSLGMFNTDANVDAENKGILNGITATGKNIDIDNYNEMNGDYVANNILVTNNAGGNFGSSQTTFNANNATINNLATIANADILAIGSTKLDINNTSGANMSGESTFTGDIDINNYSGGNITGTFNTNGSVAVKNEGDISAWTLNNSQNNLFVMNASTGTISGTNNINNDAGITTNIFNMGEVKGDLNISKGELVFDNMGSIEGLSTTAKDGVVANINNISGGNIAGTNIFKTTDTAIININNNLGANISGTNTFEADNADTINISNNVDGNVTGEFIVNNGVSSIENNGTITDWALSGSQSEIIINNNAGGIIDVTDPENDSTNITATGNTIINNAAGALISGSLDISGTGTVNNFGRITLEGFLPTDYIAINGKDVDVINEANGVIEGAMNVNSYHQKSDAVWVSYLNKNKDVDNGMSTIDIQSVDGLTIDEGAIIYIDSKNDVKSFEDHQEFKIVTIDGQDANAADSATLNEQLENLTLYSDSPFANFIIKENDAGKNVIEFNHVGPELYAKHTDLATANHGATILGSHRVYELFANRDVNTGSAGLSSGDSFTTTDKVSFLSIGGTSHQGNKDGHAGYDANYYGGIGYFEHDFSTNLKGGLGLAYLNTTNDFNDSLGSDASIDSYRPFAYINYDYNNWHVDLAGGVAKHKVNDKRKYEHNHTTYLSKSSYDADEYSAHLNVGYKYVLDNNVIIQPKVGAFVAKLKTDSYDERGSGPMNMNIKSEDYDSFKTMVGTKFSKEYELDNGSTLTPEMHLRWYHELSDRSGGVTAYFLAQEQLFSTSGIESPKDIGDIAFRLTSKSGTAYDLFAEAYYQFGDEFYNVGGSVGVQYNF